MISGIIFGLTAAFLMSLSYVFSKRFMLRHGSAFHLILYAQLWQGIMGLILLFLIHGKYDYAMLKDGTFCWKHIGWVVMTAALGMFGNFSFFRTLRLLEASRLSSLLGLKIILLGLICMTLLREQLNWMHWSAILLATISAVGMNFTGGKITWKAGFWLFMTLCGYAFGDLAATALVRQIGGHGIYPSLATAGLAAVVQGIGMCFLLMLKSVPKNSGVIRDSFPYALGWFASLLFLYDCFGNLGVLFGTILQSARGLISVLIGALLLKFGLEEYEPRVSRSAWIRRFIMAILMIGAMSLYAFAKN